MSACGVTPRPCGTVFLQLVGHEVWVMVFVKLPTLNIAAACAGRGAHANPTIASVTMARSCRWLIGFLSGLIRSAHSCDDGPVPRALAVAIDVLEPVLHGAVVGGRRRIGPRVCPVAQ